MVALIAVVALVACVIDAMVVCLLDFERIDATATVAMVFDYAVDADVQVLTTAVAHRHRRVVVSQHQHHAVSPHLAVSLYPVVAKRLPPKAITTKVAKKMQRLPHPRLRTREHPSLFVAFSSASK